MMVYKKIKFISPTGATSDSPVNGTTLFAYGYKGAEALKNAQNKGLGIILKY